MLFRNSARFFTFIFIFLTWSIVAQDSKSVFFAGTTLGGPSPNKTEENSYAKLKPGITAGFVHNISISEYWALSPEISFQFLNLGYGQKTQKDTIVTIDIPLQNGDVLTTDINTYYKTDVNGWMKLHFFKAGGHVTFSKNRFLFGFGPFLNYFSGGYDKGNVDVTIGEGGVGGLENHIENYNNTSFINPFAIEVSLRTQYRLNESIFVAAQLDRGVTPFFNKNFLADGSDAKFYKTTVSLKLLYAFRK